MNATENIEKISEDVANFNIKNDAEAEDFRINFLSKKGTITQLFNLLKDAVPENRKLLGAQLNELRNLAEVKLIAAKENFAISNTYNIDYDISLPVRDIKQGSLHPITLTMNKMVNIFNHQGFNIAMGAEIVDDWHNFTALNMPANHPARDMQDTFFLSKDPDFLLRTHTSSVQIKMMQSQKPPIRIISPGRVFRRDNDATHSPVFHQVEGLYVGEGVSFADLKQCLYQFVYEMFDPDVKMKFRASFFPFTEPSAEMDIMLKDKDGNEKWLEIFGCGMLDPAVLENCGIDSTVYSGYAFGIGVERVAMLKYGLSDIRVLYENDIRFLKQFANQL